MGDRSMPIQGKQEVRMSRRNWITAGLAVRAAGRRRNKRRAQAPAAAPPAATPPAAAPAAAKPPAVVNGEVISKAELDEAVKQVVGPNPVQLTDDQRRGQQMQILSLMIDDKLMHQFFAKNAAPADPNAVAARMAMIEADLKKENKTLQDIYKATGQTEATFRAELRRGRAVGVLRPGEDQRRRRGEILQGEQGLLRPGDGARQPHRAAASRPTPRTPTKPR